jgi:hypothetical protein
LVGSSGDLGLAKILIAAMIVKRKNTGFEKLHASHVLRSLLALIYEDVVAFHSTVA